MTSYVPRLPAVQGFPPTACSKSWYERTYCQLHWILNDALLPALQMATIEPVEWRPSSLTSDARARYRQGELLSFPCVSTSSHVDFQDYVHLVPHGSPPLISFLALAYHFGGLF